VSTTTPPALTLRNVRSVAVEVPLRYVLGTSAAALRTVPLLLVDVETEQGVTGRSYVFCYRKSGAHAMAAVLHDAAELIAGHVVAPLAIAARLERPLTLIGVTGIVRMALSALDMALWDALAVAAGLPLATLLGSAPRPIVSNPKARLASPIAVSTNPGRSNGRLVDSRMFSTNRLTSRTPIMPIGILIKKIQCHDA